MIALPAAPGVAVDGGYSHPLYAESLAEFGAPRALPKSGAIILERAVPGTEMRDAMGCYPLFVCGQWSALRDDFEKLRDELVSLALVTNPFGEYDEGLLHAAFPDLVRPFKTHFVADLAQSPDSFVSQHHQYYARRARKKVSVEHCAAPAALLEDWCALYDRLVERKGLAGIKAFSRASFAKQLAIPGLVMFRATESGKTVAAHLWFQHNGIAYSHLAATNERGYELMAAYALYSYALEFFAGQARYVAWGAAAGTDPGENDGLARFKRGWSNTTRTSYFCGRILNRDRYAQICDTRGFPQGGYFPAYRAGEFA